MQGGDRNPREAGWLSWLPEASLPPSFQLQHLQERTNLTWCRAFSSNCSAWCCADLNSLNVSIIVFVVWDACLCKCRAVNNAAVQLEELCNKTLKQLKY